MKIIATERPCERNRSCSSIPVIAGIWTSTIRQDVPVSCGESRKSLAEANVCVISPSDRTSRPVDARTESSSSMIEIAGTWVK